MKANRFLKETGGYSNLVPMVLAVIIVFSVLFIGTYVNGTLNQKLEDTYPSAASRTVMQNESVNRMTNISHNYDSGVDIVQVVIIITLLAGAVGAIFMFTRFR